MATAAVYEDAWGSEGHSSFVQKWSLRVLGEFSPTNDRAEARSDAGPTVLIYGKDCLLVG